MNAQPSAERNVLIVVGSPHVRNSLTRLLGSLPGVAIVGLAGGAGHGWQLFQERQPNVALLDVELPDLSGLHLLEQFRQESPSCLVIALTDDPFPALRTQCEQLGADYLLDKVHEFAELPRLLHQPGTRRPVADQLVPSGGPAPSRGFCLTT